jgi:hypothetical protein
MQKLRQSKLTRLQILKEPYWESEAGRSRQLLRAATTAN